MESELLRNDLQNIRNQLSTLARNIDNTLITHNNLTRTRNRTSARRNLNNLFSELRNIYPYNTTTTTNNTNTENLNNFSNINNLNNEINNNLRNIYPSLFTNPETIEVTLFNNGRREVNNMEDVQVFPSLRTLRESSTVNIYRDLETTQETCSICRDNFSELSVVRKLSCGHIFHIECIDTWFETNIRCPLCRVDLRDNEEGEDEEEEVS